MTVKSEEAPSPSVPENDPLGVDESIEHDFKFGTAGRTETVARAEDLHMTDAVRHNEGAKLIEGYDQSAAILSGSDNSVFSSTGRRNRQLKRDLNRALADKADSMAEKARTDKGGAAAEVRDSLDLASSMSPEDRRLAAQYHQIMAEDATNRADETGETAGRQYDEERQAAERVIGEKTPDTEPDLSPESFGIGPAPDHQGPYAGQL